MELIQSIESNDIDNVKKLLLDENINFQDENGNSLLLRAINKNNIEIAKLLISNKNIDLNIRNKFGYTALIRAVKSTNIDIVKLLLNNDEIDINIQNNFGDTALIRAVDSSIEITKLLLEKPNIDINTKNNNGETALMRAIIYNNIEMIKLLLKNNKIDVNIQDKYGDIFLMWAINNNNLEILKLLLDNNCNININMIDENGDSPLLKAVNNNNTEILKLLLSKSNIDVNTKDKYGDTALARAVYNNYTQIIKLLLSNNNIDVNTRDKFGDTLLIRAVDINNLDLIRMSLDNTKIDVNIKNKYGYTALIKAVKNNNIEITKLLLENSNIDVNIRDEDGNTPLIIAVNRNNIEIIKLFLNNKNNIDINIHNKYGRTALIEAAFRDHYDICILLMNRYDIKLDVNITFQSSELLLKKDLVNGNVILHYAVSNNSCNINIIKNIVNTCPSCVNITNNDNKTPLDMAIDNQLSVDVIAILLLYSSISSSVFSWFSSSSNNYSSHPLYGPLVKLLQSTSYDSVVRLHLCGYDGAGKSTLRQCIEASLSNYFNSYINPLNTSTVGMDITSFIDNRVKHVVFDYGGQSEYHVNHSRFMRGNNSIYVIVLNLSRFRDSEGNRLQSPLALTADELSDLSDKYKYWLKFVNISTSNSSIDESVIKAHVITCLNCDGSLMRSSSSSSIIKSSIEMISNIQNQWMNGDSSLNRINFVNIGSDICVVNMISTESVYYNIIPILRSKVTEIATVSTNNFKLVDEILTLRDNEKCFDIGPRSAFIYLIMNTFPSAFPSNIKSGLAEAALSQLELIGEVFIFDNGDSNEQLVVTNPNKLSSSILGKLAQYLNSKKKRLKTQYVDFHAYLVTRDEILNQISSSIRYCEGVKNEVIIQLLELLGVCIKCSENNWFPVFAADNGNIQETNIFELSPEFRKYSRRVHRRYKLSDIELQMFPLGYFSTMFVYISSMAVIEGNFQLYSNSILIPERGRVGEGGLPHMETIVKISEDRSYFDVIVQSWVDEEPLDNIGESRYWNRLNAINDLLKNDSKFINYYGVDIEEYLIHPDPLFGTERQLNDITNPKVSSSLSQHELWPWIFGINGNKYGVNDPTLIQRNEQNPIDKLDLLINSTKNIESRIEILDYRMVDLDHTLLDGFNYVSDKIDQSVKSEDAKTKVDPIKKCHGPIGSST